MLLHDGSVPRVGVRHSFGEFLPFIPPSLSPFHFLFILAIFGFSDYENCIANKKSDAIYIPALSFLPYGFFYFFFSSALKLHDNMSFFSFIQFS